MSLIWQICAICVSFSAWTCKTQDRPRLCLITNPPIVMVERFSAVSDIPEGMKERLNLHNWISKHELAIFIQWAFSYSRKNRCIFLIQWIKDEGFVMQVAHPIQGQALATLVQNNQLQKRAANDNWGALRRYFSADRSSLLLRFLTLCIIHFYLCDRFTHCNGFYSMAKEQLALFSLWFGYFEILILTLTNHHSSCLNLTNPTTEDNKS